MQSPMFGQDRSRLAWRFDINPGVGFEPAARIQRLRGSCPQIGGKWRIDKNDVASVRSVVQEGQRVGGMHRRIGYAQPYQIVAQRGYQARIAFDKIHRSAAA